MTDRSQQLLRDGLRLKETIYVDIFRPLAGGGYSKDPSERFPADDLITTVGRNYIAQRIAFGDTTASAMAYMAVGTGTTAASLNQTILVGEVKRKALCVSSTGITAANVYTAVMTLGGSADTVTSLAITEAGIFNHASSGQGTMMQRVTFAAVTLANSDLLRLTLETNVGST